MEAHNALSAKVVEEVGFKGVWASSLTISAAQGVRDCNELSWTQVSETVEHICDATRIPVLVDGDTGYGNFNNARRSVAKLMQRGAAGICLEDKAFPKLNSLGEGSHTLAAAEEFAGKLAACKDTCEGSDFCIVARVEALIAGESMQSAVSRAQLYTEAGADAILIHSKKEDGVEILEFLDRWANRHPIIVVPTAYWRMPTEELIKRKVSLVIWANQNLRVCMQAMRDTCNQIYIDQSLLNIEPCLPTVENLLDTVGESELRAAEQKYLPPFKRSNL
eukprot:gene28481-35315_t